MCARVHCHDKMTLDEDDEKSKHQRFANKWPARRQNVNVVHGEKRNWPKKAGEVEKRMKKFRPKR